MAPALDPDDPLAREQLRLAVEYVAFVRSRIDHLHGRERFDLRHYIGIATAMLEAGVPADGDEGDFLTRTLATASALAESPAAQTGQVREAAMELAHAVTGVVRVAAQLPPGVSEKVRRIILDATRAPAGIRASLVCAHRL